MDNNVASILVVLWGELNMLHQISGAFRPSIKYALAATAAVATMSCPAEAALTTLTFKVTAHGAYDHGSGLVGPFDPAEVNFTITFDPTLEYNPTTAGIVLNNTNIPGLIEPIAFHYYLFMGWEGPLQVGTYTIDGSGNASVGINSFDLILYGATSNNPQVPFFRYITADVMYYGSATVDRLPSPSAAVPEPASWALMIAGFALAGTALRRRQQVAICFA